MSGSSNPQIVKLLAEVMSEVGGIDKDGQNSAQRYRFRSIDAVLTRLQPMLAKRGIAVVPSVVDHAVYGRVRGTEDKVTFSDVVLGVRFIAPDGSHVDASAHALGSDSLDKSGNKAMTAAFKTLLCQTFAIPYGDPDPDAATPDDVKRSREELDIEKRSLLSEVAQLRADTASRMNHPSWAKRVAADVLGYPSPQSVDEVAAVRARLADYDLTTGDRKGEEQ